TAEFAASAAAARGGATARKRGRAATAARRSAQGSRYVSGGAGVVQEGGASRWRNRRAEQYRDRRSDGPARLHRRGLELHVRAEARAGKRRSSAGGACAAVSRRGAVPRAAYGRIRRGLSG